MRHAIKTPLISSVICGVLLVAPRVQAAERIKIGYIERGFSQLPMQMAMAKGFFREEGLEVELLQARPNILLSALSAGEMAFITALGSSIRAAMKGLPVKVIAGVTNYNPDFLMVRPEVKQVADLKGKILAVSSFGAATHQRLILILRVAGLDPTRDVKIIAVGDTAIRLEQLKLGQIDGTVVSLPHNFYGERQGFKPLASTRGILELPAVGLTTTDKMLKENPELVKRVIRGLLKGMRHVKESPEETIQLAISWLGLDREIAEKSYALMLPNYAVDGRVPLVGLQATIKLAREESGGDDVPISKVADFTLLEEVLKTF